MTYEQSAKKGVNTTAIVQKLKTEGEAADLTSYSLSFATCKIGHKSTNIRDIPFF
jgi:hypothetical protein